jgi:hypothetical protein
MNRLERDLALMRDPARWPARHALYLKRYINLKPDYTIQRIDFGMLFYLSRDGRFKFVPEDIDHYETLNGGDELLVELTTQGWLVD